MKLEVYYVDAFTSEMFSGNPAAVIFSELNDEALMQKIATENNLSETAFVNLKIIQLDGFRRHVKLIYVVMQLLLQPISFLIF